MNSLMLSVEAEAFIRNLRATPRPPPMSDSADIGEWLRRQVEVEERMRPACEAAIEKYGAVLATRRYASLNTLDIRCPGTVADAAPSIYLHGGGYVSFSATSSLCASVPIAAALRRPLLSIDYPLAPQVNHAVILEETAASIEAICDRFGPVALIGDSAGGGLALDAILRLSAHDRARPSALVLISPWADLARRGASRETMALHDPVLTLGSLEAAVGALGIHGMAPDTACPVMADYPACFPPTMILCGTDDVLFSDSVRLYRKLRQSGANCDLLPFDGLFHSFPVIAPELPEADEARMAMRDFLDRELPMQKGERGG